MLALCAASAFALIGAAPSLAASPQTIYKDLADNGRLDGHYTRADITRAFDFDQVVKTDRRKPARTSQTPAAKRQLASTKRSDGRRVPFTGLDLALLTVGGGPLLLIAVGLRRRLAPTAGHAGVVEG